MRDKKLRVAVLMGGPSSEHEVSLKSGEMVLKHLDQRKFQAFPVKIGKDSSWPIGVTDLKEKADIAFIAMHGFYGEDGQIQGILAKSEIPYTGSNPIASARAMNKADTLLLLKSNGYPMLDYFVVEKGDRAAVDWKNPKKIPFPVVVKPANGGSSVGIHIVKNSEDLSDAVMDAFRYGDSILIQDYVSGREVTCGVLEINGASIALVPTEIIPKNSEFFDYQSKYTAGASAEITPPDMPKELIKKIQRFALGAHQLLGCSGMSRTDMIIDKNGEIYILELNTIPGLTGTSLLPQQAEKMGFSFSNLLEIIIQSGLNKNSSGKK